MLAHLRVHRSRVGVGGQVGWLVTRLMDTATGRVKEEAVLSITSVPLAGADAGCEEADTIWGAFLKYIYFYL